MLYTSTYSDVQTSNAIAGVFRGLDSGFTSSTQLTDEALN